MYKENYRVHLNIVYPSTLYTRSGSVVEGVVEGVVVDVVFPTGWTSCEVVFCRNIVLCLL